MFRRFFSKQSTQKFIVSLPALTFTSMVLNDIKDQVDIEIREQEIEDTKFALDFLKNEAGNFQDKTNLFNYLKEKDEDRAVNICFYLIEKDVKNEIHDYNVKQEDIDYAISSLEEEKKKQESQLRPYHNPYPIQCEDQYFQFFSNLAIFYVIKQLGAKQINGFVIKGVNPFFSFRNLIRFPFFPAMLYSILFERFVINSLLLSTFALLNALKFGTNTSKKFVVTEYLKGMYKKV